LNEEGGEHQFTDKNFRDTLLNFILAGRDSTAVTLSWLVYMTTVHPHVGDKIFHELLALDTSLQAVNPDSKCGPETLGGEDDFNQRILRFSELLTFDSLLKLHYLHACIMETLRLYPPVPMNGKCLVADDVLPDGTAVKKGHMVMYTPYAMGRMPALWGLDATEFKPERWLVDGVVKPESPFKFSAFQAGPRICLGKDSAMLQLRTTLALLFRFFKFQLEPNAVIKYRTQAVLTLAHGLHVKISKRCD